MGSPPLISQNRLVRVLNDYSVKPAEGDSELFVVYPSGRGLSRKAQVFVDFLTELFEREDAARPADALGQQTVLL